MMGERPARPIEVYAVDEVVHVRVDAPGERAVSAPVSDVMAFVRELAECAGFEVDGTVEGETYISWPAS
jgi:hypothetical protein